MPSVNPETEQLYMPSRWVQRVKPEEACLLHVETTTRDSQLAREHPSARLAVRVGPDSSDVVDIYNETGQSGQIVVYVSGGYWTDLSGDISSYPVLPLIAAGHTVVILHYERAPKRDMEGIINQVSNCLVWIVSYAEKINKKIWLAGHSAGAHLCAMALFSPPFQGLTPQSKLAVSGVIHFSGVFWLEPILSTSVNSVLQLTTEESELYSPISQANINRLKELKGLKQYQILGEFDSPAFHHQAELYRSVVCEAGCQMSIEVLEGLDHFNLVENLSQPHSTSTKTFLSLIQ